jgi:hypothetical protein
MAKMIPRKQPDRELEACIKAVCAFPRRYQTEGLSPLQVFRETGYADHHDQITPEVLAEELRKNPDWIGDWYIWSENKRSSPSWFISQIGPSEWIVAMLERDGRRSQVHTFSTALSATAFFVKMEMEHFRE